MNPGEFSPEVKAMVDGRAGSRCEVCGEYPISEYHHRRPRGSGGSKRSDTGSVVNCLGLCRECHRMIEKHRNVARLLGWLVPQEWHPRSQMVMYRGRRALLNEYGQVIYADAA